jgi:hypothetical protein
MGFNLIMISKQSYQIKAKGKMAKSVLSAEQGRR